MKIKSKSSLWHNIIEQVDEQLSKIPSHDVDGTPLEDSLRFDDYKDSLKELKIKTEDNKEINPIHTTILIEDYLRLNINFYFDLIKMI